MDSVYFKETEMLVLWNPETKSTVCDKSVKTGYIKKTHRIPQEKHWMLTVSDKQIEVLQYWF